MGWTVEVFLVCLFTLVGFYIGREELAAKFRQKNIINIILVIVIITITISFVIDKVIIVIAIFILLAIIFMMMIYIGHLLECLPGSWRVREEGR